MPGTSPKEHPRNPTPMTQRLQMRGDHWEQMRSHVQECEPLEGCGLLFGVDKAVERVIPVANAAQSPDRFRMEPAAQVRAFQEMENQGLQLLGIFHSHPSHAGDRTQVLEGPSETDVREAAYAVVHVIWSHRSGGWRARGFWIEQDKVREVPLAIAAVQ